MLSIDAARASGYRDSLYFFRKNPLVLKLNCTQAEKDMLIARGRLSANLKSRAVTMVSARNVFKAMGATFVRGAVLTLPLLVTLLAHELAFVVAQMAST